MKTSLLPPFAVPRPSGADSSPCERACDAESPSSARGDLPEVPGAGGWPFRWRLAGEKVESGGFFHKKEEALGPKLIDTKQFSEM